MTVESVMNFCRVSLQKTPGQRSQSCPRTRLLEVQVLLDVRPLGHIRFLSHITLLQSPQ